MISIPPVRVEQGIVRLRVEQRGLFFFWRKVVLQVRLRVITKDPYQGKPVGDPYVGEWKDATAKLPSELSEINAALERVPAYDEQAFTLDADQIKKVNDWRLANLEKHRAEGGDDYAGAIGGALTYSFTPTSLGMVVKVRDDLTKAELDLSDYENW